MPDIFETLDHIAAEYGEEWRGLAPDEPISRRMLQTLHDRYRHDPLIQQYVRASTGLRAAPITAPWMALAEQRLMALAQTLPSAPTILTDEPQHIAHTRLAMLLSIAHTYMWSREITNTLIAYPMPPHIVSRDILPFPFTYHSFENAHAVRSANSGISTVPEDAETDWKLVVDIPNGQQCVVYQNISSLQQQRVEIAVSSISYNRRFPDDFPEYSRPGLSMILSMFAFLRSPYTIIEKRPAIPRQWRRHESGLTAEDNERHVTVIRLRREAKEAVEQYNAESKSWKHRWWVAGHFRAQWYPSRQAHEVVWIAPYLKGPSEAPLLHKIHAVVR